MASMEKYDNDEDVLKQLNHDFRSSPKPPRNTEIDPELSKNNYSLAPENHGRSAEKCHDYYKQLLDNSYIYGKDSNREITRALQWSIQEPADLSPEQKPEFFAACTEYMNDFYGEQNCIAAVVHTDEIMLDAKGNRVSHDHLHYIAVPRVENPRYLTKAEKFEKGLSKLHDSGLLMDKADAQKAASVIDQHYRHELSRNEAVSMLAKELDCKYAEARKIFTATVRRDSESHRMKLCSDAVTSRKQLHEFHAGLQQFLDERGIRCTVSYKSQGLSRDVSFTVAEAKTVTRITGHSVKGIKALEVENERLREQVKSLAQELEKSRERISGWGRSSEWGKEVDKSWEKEF